MTRKIYLEDQYRRELITKVVSVQGDALILESTVFYPTGGGQPCDTGSIEINGSTYEVSEVKKAGDEVLHIINTPLSVENGAQALCKINWPRRYQHMRYHTALHILDGVITREHLNGTITGGMIYEDRAHIDIDLPALNKELAAKLVDAAQIVINEGRLVKAKFLSKSEALAIPDLARTGPGKALLEKLDSVRVIEIEGLDMQLDGGTHVANTKEIGTLALSKFENKGAHRKRIEVKLS